MLRECVCFFFMFLFLFISRALPLVLLMQTFATDENMYFIIYDIQVCQDVLAQTKHKC